MRLRTRCIQVPNCLNDLVKEEDEIVRSRLKYKSKANCASALSFIVKQSIIPGKPVGKNQNELGFRQQSIAPNSLGHSIDHRSRKPLQGLGLEQS